MTIRYIGDGKYTALAADAKPTVPSPTLNAELLETDTKNRFYYNGTAWVTEKLNEFILVFGVAANTSNSETCVPLGSFIRVIITGTEEDKVQLLVGDLFGGNAVLTKLTATLWGNSRDAGSIIIGMRKNNATVAGSTVTFTPTVEFGTKTTADLNVSLLSTDRVNGYIDTRGGTTGNISVVVAARFLAA